MSDPSRPPASQAAGQSAIPASEHDDEVPEASAINDAAVAAYRLSVQAGNPLSERRLAQMSGRISRRWALWIAQGYRAACQPAGNSAPNECIAHTATRPDWTTATRSSGSAWPGNLDFSITRAVSKSREEVRGPCHNARAGRFGPDEPGTWHGTPVTRSARCGDGVEMAWRWHGKCHVRPQVLRGMLNGGTAACKNDFPVTPLRPGSPAGKGR